MTALARITVYPIKSLDGVDLEESHVLPSGALLNDRRWAIIDEAGNYVNGKRTTAVHSVRAQYSQNCDSVTLSAPTTDSATFGLFPIATELCSWLFEVLEMRCRLVENGETGFPDDLDFNGPTLVSLGTIRETANWFALTEEEIRHRFRANLVVDAEEPFWEDRLVGTADRPVPFSIGRANWLGVNPCQRCVVPSRDSTTGEATAKFQREFTQRRQASLPAWSPRDRFDHFYRLAVNTRLAEVRPEMRIRVGDEIRHLDSGASLF